MPLSLKGGPLCHASALANFIVSVISKRLLPADIRLRSRIHCGTPSQVLTDLSGFSLPMDRVPAHLGRLLPVPQNAPEWAMKRQILEMLRDGSMSAALATVALESIQSQQESSSQAYIYIYIIYIYIYCILNDRLPLVIYKVKQAIVPTVPSCIVPVCVTYSTNISAKNVMCCSIRENLTTAVLYWFRGCMHHFFFSGS